MAEQQPMPEQALCYTAAEDRQALKALIQGEGVVDVPGGDLLVTTAGSGLNLLVAAGGAYIQGDDSAPDQGMYRVRNDASLTLTATGAASPGAGQLVTGIPNANGTNPRIDQVVAVVRDSEYGGISDDFRVMVLTGTATGTAALTPAGIAASAAALPNNTIRLAYILVPTSFAGPFVNATHIQDSRNAFSMQSGQPRIKVYRVAALASPTVAADMVFDTVVYNTFGEASGTVGSAGTLYATNTGIFTAPSIGFYRVTWNMGVTTGATTDLINTSILVNAATQSSQQTGAGQTGVGITQLGSTVVQVTTAGHQIKMQWNTDVSRTTTVNQVSQTYMVIEKVG